MNPGFTTARRAVWNIAPRLMQSGAMILFEVVSFAALVMPAKLSYHPGNGWKTRLP